MPSKSTWQPPTAGINSRGQHEHAHDPYGNYYRNGRRNSRDGREIISGSPLKRFGWRHAVEQMQSVADQFVGMKDGEEHLRVAKDLRNVSEWLNRVDRGPGRIQVMEGVQSKAFDAQ
ncbi:uncharacterized protein DFL_001101 [Arthrobotrys flagrans]|uniref:Uncharacterized protein n=1 Tax=Arthrobotrys flagrans TaxID=97331 RepID=A0A437AG66_ARTFL|nr:hypothetical protein DFL_001101 [Arthrobotrys flagrans]